MFRLGLLPIRALRQWFHVYQTLIRFSPSFLKRRKGGDNEVLEGDSSKRRLLSHPSKTKEVPWSHRTTVMGIHYVMKWNFGYTWWSPSFVKRLVECFANANWEENVQEGGILCGSVAVERCVLILSYPYPSPYSSLSATSRILVILSFVSYTSLCPNPFNRHTERKEMLTVFVIAMRYFSCSYFSFWEPLGSWVRWSFPFSQLLFCSFWHSFTFL